MANRRLRTLADAKNRRDFTDHIGVGGNCGERDQLNRALPRLAGHGLREPGLPQTTGAHDRDHSRRVQQLDHRRDVPIPSEQRVRLVWDTAPDDRPLGCQQLPVHPLQLSTRIAAQLLAQPAPVRVVPDQCCGRPQRRGFAEQQPRQDLLVARVLADQLPESVAGVGVPPETRKRQRAAAHECSVRRSPRRAQLSQRIAELREVPLPTRHHRRRRVPQRQPRLGPCERSRVIPHACGPRAIGRKSQHSGRVDLLIAQRQPITDRRAGDRVRAEHGSRARDQHLQRSGRMLRLLVRPQPLDQPVRAAAPVQVVGEQREQPAEPRPGDLPPPKRDSRQQH